MSQTSHAATTPIDSQPSQATGPAVPVSAELIPESLTPGIRQTRLLEKAIRERWPISDEMRKAIMIRQSNIAVSPRSSAREATSAARAIISAVSHNLEITKLELAEEAKAAGDDVNKHVHVHLGEGGSAYRPPIRNVIVNRPAPLPAPASTGPDSEAPVNE